MAGLGQQRRQLFYITNRGKMKKKFFLIFITILICSANVIAQSGTNYTIYLDTKNKTGHLVYEEGYYLKNNTGGLEFDQARIYFDGNINNSKIRLYITRPTVSAKTGKPYVGAYIWVVAKLDNKTIIKSWYTAPKDNQSIVADTTPNKSPGFEIVMPVTIILAIYIARKRKKIIR